MTRSRIEGRFELDRDTVDALVEHGRSDFPFEVCGLLAGRGGTVEARYQIPNEARSMTFYTMEPRAMLHAFNDMEERGLDLLAIYHTHTHTEAFPSPTDVELAFYPEAVYLIVSLQDPHEPIIRAFDIVDQRISERVLTVGGEEAPVGSR